ncbi:hypothetical protein [Desulfovibrio aminophilus]|uniref:hypothetical protein n=1 Tax=Desulfovibrio aminophilus TaxID=81425 RepID=UPI003392B30C
MIRVTSAMIARYMPGLMTGGSDSSQTSETSAAGAQVAARKCIQDNDKNRDNVLTKDEVTISDEAFQKLDANGDNAIDRDEMRAYLNKNGKAIQTYVKNYKSLSKTSNILNELMDNSSGNSSTDLAKAATEYIKKNDKNSDGVLSRSETKMASESFTRIDTNKDGVISAEELTTFLKGSQQLLDSITNSSTSNDSSSTSKVISNYIDKNDKDKDGKLARSETKLTAEAFAKLDTDGDGKLSAEELKKLVQSNESLLKSFSSASSSTSNADLLSYLIKQGV